MDRQDRPNALASGIYSPALALAIAMARVGGVGATPLERGGGAALGVGRTEHVSYESTDVRVDAAPELDQGATAVVANSAGALVINPTFDSSITSDPNSAAIEAMITNAISIHESLFNDPIVVSIRFRYSMTYADGTTPLPSGFLAASESVIYREPWNTYISALTADATTANDATANASLPDSALSTIIDPSSANGRAIGLNTPPVMFADGSLGAGGPYDGIVTLNSSKAFKFTRPPTSGMYDAQRLTEHEIDEVLGLGSSINVRSDLRPQDMFSWSAAGVRNLMSSGSRYFSIDSGNTNLVGFNQDPSGDFGDWLSGSCPQGTPYVQDAFSCANQASDVTRTSPEGINLDVIGYDLIMTSMTTTTSRTPTTTTTTPPCQPPQVECCPAGQPGCGVCGTDCGNGACCPPAYPVCDNADRRCAVQAPSGPECSPGQVPCNDAALGFTDVACCSQPTKKKQCAGACSAIIAECKAGCTTLSHPRKCKKRCQTAIVGHCKRSQPHACS